MDAPGRSPWAVLGIPEDATLADARRAFRRLVKQAHPDTGGDGRTLAAVVAAFDELRHLLPPPPSVPRSPRHPRRPTPYDAFLSPPARSRTWAEAPTFTGRVRMRPTASHPTFAAVLDAELAKVRANAA